MNIWVFEIFKDDAASDFMLFKTATSAMREAARWLIQLEILDELKLLKTITDPTSEDQLQECQYEKLVELYAREQYGDFVTLFTEHDAHSEDAWSRFSVVVREIDIND